MFPQAGGLYAFVRESWGPLPAFLFGWTYLLINPAGWAAISMVFAEYLGKFVPLTETGRAASRSACSHALVRQLPIRAAGRLDPERLQLCETGGAPGARAFHPGAWESRGRDFHSARRLGAGFDDRLSARAGCRALGLRGARNFLQHDRRGQGASAQRPARAIHRPRPRDAALCHGQCRLPLRPAARRRPALAAGGGRRKCPRTGRGSRGADLGTRHGLDVRRGGLLDHGGPARLLRDGARRQLLLVHRPHSPALRDAARRDHCGDRHRLCLREHSQLRAAGGDFRPWPDAVLRPCNAGRRAVATHAPGHPAPLPLPGSPVVLLLYVSAAAIVLGNALLHAPEITAINLGLSAAGIPVYFAWKKLRR